MTNDLVSTDGTTTSRIVAEKFGREHKNVLADVRNLGCSDEFRRLNFQQSEYTNEQGRPQPMYRMTRDGFMLLVMGFKTERAMEWKERFITAFNEWERQAIAAPVGSALTAEIASLIKLQEMERQNRIEQHREIRNDLFSLETRVTNLEKKRRAHIAPLVKRKHLECLRWLAWRCPLTGQVIPHTEDGEPLLGQVEFDHFYQVQTPDLYHTWPLSKISHAALTTGKMTREEAQPHFRAYQLALDKMLKQEPQQLDIFKANANAHA